VDAGKQLSGQTPVRWTMDRGRSHAGTQSASPVAGGLAGGAPRVTLAQDRDDRTPGQGQPDRDGWMAGHQTPQDRDGRTRMARDRDRLTDWKAQKEEGRRQKANGRTIARRYKMTTIGV
jgi:hypothetical protein